MTISWTAVGVLISAMTLITGLAVAYLRMFVSQQTLAMAQTLRETILEAVQDGYLPKPKGELFDARFAELERRISRLETRP